MTTTASDLDVPRSRAVENGNTPLVPAEDFTAAPDLISTPGVEDVSTDSVDGLRKTAGFPDPAPLSTNSVGGRTDSSRSKLPLKWKGISEMVRTSNTTVVSCEPPFEAQEGSEADITAIIQRADLVRAPWHATPAPTGTKPYGTTEELFARIQSAIAAQALVPATTSALLAYWTISTWFTDGLPLAPGLSIVGPRYEGDLLLRTLRNYCRYPLMMTEVNTNDLRNVDWQVRPTLLIFGPAATKQMVSLLDCTTSRGYSVGTGDGRYKDYYGSKAIYLGEEVSIDRTPRSSVQVHLNPIPARTTQNSPRLSEAKVQDLQNQLLKYRLKNLVRIYHSDFDAAELPSETRTIANACGACIIDSPKLQSNLVSLLNPAVEQRLVDRSVSLEVATLEAALAQCHKGKTQILVSEIATEVNRIAKARGERLSYSPEIIGHRLKKVGLFTRRLGKVGNGLTLDMATTTRIHELAAAYGVVGLSQDDGNLHCLQCNENAEVM